MNVFGNRKKSVRTVVAIFFEMVKVEGVAWNAGIRNGDQLIEIAGVPLLTMRCKPEILNKYETGEYAEYKYLRDGELFTNKSLRKETDSVRTGLQALLAHYFGC